MAEPIMQKCHFFINETAKLMKWRPEQALQFAFSGACQRHKKADALNRLKADG
jgi:hypothetical protein